MCTELPTTQQAGVLSVLIFTVHNTNPSRTHRNHLKNDDPPFFDAPLPEGFHSGVFHMRLGGGIDRQRRVRRGPDRPAPVRVGSRGDVAPQARAARHFGASLVSREQ